MINIKIIKIISRLFFITIVLLAILAIYNQYQIYRYESSIGYYLQIQIEEAQTLNYHLRHQLEHHLSDVYVEIAAREMGLIGPHEILFIPIH